MEALCAQLSAHRKQPAHANCRHNKGKKAKTKVKSASKSGSKHGEESSSRSNSRVHGSALLRPNSVSAAGASDAIPRWLVTLHCLAVSRYCMLAGGSVSSCTSCGTRAHSREAMELNLFNE